MLHVDLDKILTEDDAISRIKEIFTHVEEQKEIYVVTHNGRPTVAVVSVDELEKSMGSMSMEPTMETPQPMEDKPMFSMPETTPAPAPEHAPEPATDEAPALPPMGDPEPSMPTLDHAPTPDLPPLSGTDSLGSTPPAAPVVPAPDLPDMPVDPSNSSPLA